MKRSVFRTLSILFICHSAILYAQDTLYKELKEITVIATRTEKNILETGRNVSVISRDEIEKSTCLTLGELLAYQNGIFINGAGQNPGSTQGIFLRGANSNQTAVFLDGIRISDVSTVNNTIDFSELPLNNLEKIEIIRGSHSTLYGSGAIGGVIQLYTKKSAETGRHISATINSGVFGKGTRFINPGLSANARNKKGYYVNVTGDYADSRGLDATIDTVTINGVFKNRDKDDWNKIGGGITFGKSGEKLNYSAYYKTLTMKTDIDRAAFIDDDNYVLDYKRSTTGIDVKYDFNARLNLQFISGYTSNTRDAINDSSIIDESGHYDRQYTEDHFEGSSLQTEMLMTKIFNHGHVLTGLSFIKDEMSQKNYLYSAMFDPYIIDSRTELANPKPEYTETSVFAQAELNGGIITDKLKHFSILGGLRFVSQSAFGEKLLFEINPSYKLSNHALIYFSYNNGFKSPSLYQLYATETYQPWDGSVTSQLSRGNKNLKAELSYSYEIGIKQKLTSSSFVQMSLYRSITDNLIEYVYLWNSSIPVSELGTDFNRDDYRGDRYINAGKQTVYGFDITYSSSLSQKIFWTAGISLLNGYLDYSEQNINSETSGGNYVQLYSNGTFLKESGRYEGLIRRPSSAVTSLNWQCMTELSLQSSLRYTGALNDVFYDVTVLPYGALAKTPVGDHTLLDLMAVYKPCKSFSIAARVENITNEKYQEILGFSTRGRSFYLKIGLNL